jgi:hypothetical protein
MGVDWINLAQDRDLCLTPVKMLMKHGVVESLVLLKKF